MFLPIQPESLIAELIYHTMCLLLEAWRDQGYPVDENGRGLVNDITLGDLIPGVSALSKSQRIHVYGFLKAMALARFSEEGGPLFHVLRKQPKSGRKPAIPPAPKEKLRILLSAEATEYWKGRGPEVLRRGTVQYVPQHGKYLN